MKKEHEDTSEAIVPLAEAAIQTPSLPPMTAEQRARVKGWVAAGIPENTKRAYGSDWKHFEKWCKEVGHPSLPTHPQTLVLFLSEHGEAFKLSTLRRRLAAITRAHRAKGYSTPCNHPLVKEFISRMRVAKGEKPEKKAAIDRELLEKMIGTLLPMSMSGKRDRAILLLGFAGAFRRSEFASLRVEQLEWRRECLVLHLGRTKTDQEGRGAVIPIVPNPDDENLCPVKTLRKWLKAAKIKAGYVFPGKRPGKPIEDRVVAEVVKRAAAAVGLDPKDFGAHSLRAGFITQMFRDGARESDIMAQSRHKSYQILLGYKREADPLQGNAAANLWKPPTKK